jgi:glutaredoxin-like YruB-family protein
MPKVIIYTTTTCPFCKMAKDFFKENNVEYTEKNVEIDGEALKEMVEKSGQMGVPVIDIDNQIIIGFDEEAFRNILKI